MRHRTRLTALVPRPSTSKLTLSKLHQASLKLKDKLPIYRTKEDQALIKELNARHIPLDLLQSVPLNDIDYFGEAYFNNRKYILDLKHYPLFYIWKIIQTDSKEEIENTFYKTIKTIDDFLIKNHGYTFSNFRLTSKNYLQENLVGFNNVSISNIHHLALCLASKQITANILELTTDKLDELLNQHKVTFEELYKNKVDHLPVEIYYQTINLMHWQNKNITGPSVQETEIDHSIHQFFNQASENEILNLFAPQVTTTTTSTQQYRNNRLIVQIDDATVAAFDKQPLLDFLQPGVNDSLSVTYISQFSVFNSNRETNVVDSSAEKFHQTKIARK